MKPYRFIISGGGTGGHIYPAIAIADALKAKYPNAQFLFVGAKDRMEMEKVPKAGYEIKGLWISGIQRKLTWSNLMFPFKLMSSLLKARKIINAFRPDVVIGTGGFASGPLLEVASRKGIPALIQEQNSYAGITNKLLSKKVQKICVAYDKMTAFFPENKIVKTGNPVRQDLLSLQAGDLAKSSFGLEPDTLTVLVLGGSLGAREVNKHIAHHIKFFKNLGVQVIWQTGKLYYEQYKEFNKIDGVTVVAFIDEMNTAYAAAGIIISRAGAGSVSELSIVGKPVLFIPSPNVAEDHQTKNALAVTNKKAAITIAEKDLSKKFKPVFKKLVEDSEYRTMLGENIKTLALPHATHDIVQEIEKLLPRA